MILLSFLSLTADDFAGRHFGTCLASAFSGKDFYMVLIKMSNITPQRFELPRGFLKKNKNNNDD